MQDVLAFLQLHWVLSLTLIITLALLIIIEYVKQKKGAIRVNPAQLTQLINHKNAVIIDVRDTNAFQSGHIVGAISIPLKNFEEKLKKIEKFKTQPIVLVCGSGTESARGVASLQKEGFTVYLLEGGINAWKTAEMPLVKN